MISTRTGNHFLESVSCCATPLWETADPRSCLNELRRAMAGPLEVLKSDGMKRTLKVYLAPWGEVCLQDFCWNFKRIMLSPFRWSRGKRIWHYSRAVSGAGVPVLEPLLFLEIKRAFFVTRTFIVTPWLKEKIDLGRMAMSEELRRVYGFDNLLNQAVDLILRLHGLGFLHGDLKWSNFVVASGDHDGLILTDLDGLRRSSSSVLRGKDYARFVLSAPAYGVDWVSPASLMDRYLSGTRGSDFMLTRSLRWHVARKIGRYQRQNLPTDKGKPEV